MRYLLLVSSGFAAGCAGFIRLLSGRSLYIAMAVLLILGIAGLLLRKRKAWRGLCCCALACALALGYCQLYSAYYLEPMRLDAEREQAYVAEVCREPELLSSGWYSIEVRVHPAGRATRAVLYSRQEVACEIGDRFSFVGKLKWADTSKGESLFYPAKGIRLTGSLPENALHIPADGLSLRNLPLRFSSRVRDVIGSLFDAQSAGLITALLTGDRALLDPALREKLSVTGIYHMVAVSGMHVAILIGIVRALCRKRRVLTAAIGLPVLAFFTLMTGAAAGTVRAALMLSILLLAPLLRRENDSPTTLGFAALLILLVNPYELASVSFQLTFCATAGILLFSGRFMDLLVKPREKSQSKAVMLLRELWYAVASILSVTLAAQLATLPLNMWYFGQISVISPLTNLLTSFVVTILFALGLLSTMLGFVWPVLALPFCFVAQHLVAYVYGVVDLLSKLPFAALYTVTPYAFIFLLFLYLAAVILFCSKERPRIAIPAACIGLVLSVCVVMAAVQLRLPAFSFTMIDVGQGQCLLCESEGQTLMIDCGGDSDAIAARAAVARIATMGTRKLDSLVLTHYDMDHAGGAAILLELLDVGTIYAPDTWDDYGLRAEIEAAAERAGTKFVAVRDEMQLLTLGGGEVTVYPPVAYTTDNETCLAVLCSFERYDILVTGDMNEASEQLLLMLYELPDLEVFVAGHHGSKHSTSALLLEVLRPELVLVSVGENSYGHPADETINRILSFDAQVRRTDEEGSIIIRR